MMCFSIAVLRIEVLHAPCLTADQEQQGVISALFLSTEELFRYRDKTNGVLLEGVCTEFDHTALNAL